MVVSERVFVKTGAGAFHLAPVPLEGRLHSGKLRDEGVGGEELLLAAGAGEAETEVLGGVGGRERLDTQAGVQARAQGALVAPGEPVLKLGEADEDEGEERLRVPLVVEQDVEVVEDVLVEEVGLGEEEGGVEALVAELLDVGGDGVKDASGGGRWRQPERVAEEPVEVPAAEGGVVTVGEAEASVGLEAVAQRAEDAGFPDARLADEDGGAAFRERLAQFVHHGGFRRGEPEVRVGNFLGEGGVLEAEEGDVGGGHDWGPPDWGLRPTARARSALGGSKAEWRGMDSSTSGRRGGLGRREFFTGSTGWTSRRLPSNSTQGGRLRSARERQRVTILPVRWPWSSS